MLKKNKWIGNELNEIQKKNIYLSIIIVYFGELDRLKKLLSSIEDNRIRYSYEIIIVNNKHDEDIEERLRKISKNIIYIRSKQNIGYGGGNNLGSKKAKGKYLFILNPDTRIVKGSVNNLINFLEKQTGTAVVAPNLVDATGKLFDKQGTKILTPLRAIFSLSILSKILPNNMWYREYYMFNVPKDVLREVDIVPGSAFMIRASIFDKIGGFDEKFFLYFEETDFCKRIRELGMKVFMSPELGLEHDWSPYEGTNELEKIFKQSRFYYFKKHFGLLSALFVELATRISSFHIIFISIIILLCIQAALL